MKGSKKEKRFLMILIPVMFSLVLITGAAEKNSFDDLLAPHRFKVFVNVAVADVDTKAFISSHIKRELRSLQDVEIVNWVDASYFLRLVAYEPAYTANERKTGKVAVAYQYYKRFQDVELGFFQRAFHEPIVGVSAGETEDLDEICKKIVVWFDTRMLEPNRKAR